jgi:hypothetical protein
MINCVKRFIFLALLFICAQCVAIEIQPLPFFKASLSGSIESGDTEKLAKFLRTLKTPIFAVVLNSQGGDVDEAIRIAALIKFAWVGTEVQSEKLCASSCFFLFLAGSGRIASPDFFKQPEELEALNALARQASVNRKLELPGFVGLHRPFYTTASNIEKHQSAMMERVSAHLKKQMISSRLIDAMMSHPSNDVYWLTDLDLNEIGQYPPEQEEVFIQRCGYDRNSVLEEISLIEKGNVSKSDETFQQGMTSYACIARLKEKLSTAALEQIKKGWLPPVSRITAVR